MHDPLASAGCYCGHTGFGQERLNRAVRKLWVYVCMDACIHAWMDGWIDGCVCVCTYVYVCLYVCLYVCIYVYMNRCMYVHTYIYMYVCLRYALCVMRICILNLLVRKCRNMCALQTNFQSECEYEYPYTNHILEGMKTNKTPRIQ